MDFAPLLAAIALIWKIVDTVKYLRAGNRDAVFTQLGVWFAGVGVVLLLAATDFANGIEVAEFSMDKLNIASLILLGLTIGSSASVAVDLKKAIDNSDSAAVPASKPTEAQAIDLMSATQVRAQESAPRRRGRATP